MRFHSSHKTWPWRKWTSSFFSFLQDEILLFSQDCARRETLSVLLSVLFQILLMIHIANNKWTMDTCVPTRRLNLLFRLFNANLSFDIFGSFNPQGLRMLFTSILIKSKKIEVPVNSKSSIAFRLSKIMFDWRVYFQVKSIKRWKQLLISAISKYVDFIGVLQSNYLCNLASCRCRQKLFRISNYCLLKGSTYYQSKWVSSK